MNLVSACMSGRELFSHLAILLDTLKPGLRSGGVGHISLHLFSLHLRCQ